VTNETRAPPTGQATLVSSARESKGSTGMVEAWQDCLCVFVEAPACPHCRSLRFVRVRSQAGGDGSVTRRCICAACSRRFNVVVELPDGSLPDTGKV